MRTRFICTLGSALLAMVAACGSSSPTAQPQSSGWKSYGAADVGEKVATGGKEASSDAPAKAAKTAPAATPEPTIDTRPRIGALGPHTWIYKRAAIVRPALGKMRIGTSVVLKSTEPVPGEGCPGGWYAVEPRGFVCNDNTATLDLEDPYYKALAFSAPEPGLWPYRYTHSDGAPMYSRVPTPEEWQQAERKHGEKGFKPLGDWAIGHEELISGKPIVATDEVPYFLKGGKRLAPGGNYHTAALVWKTIPAGSMLAYSKAFEMHGRVWLLTPDTMVVPADRTSDMRRSTFKGVYFDQSEMTLPFGWNRSKKPIPYYRRDDRGEFHATEETLASKAPVEITGDQIKHGDRYYYELRKRPGVFISKSAKDSRQLDAEVTVSRKAEKLPRGIEPGQKWIEVRIVPGTLTAYVGTEPVMATMFSPGKGGPPVPGLDHEKYATTATGFFPLEWKERVATMSNEPGEPKILWFTDVPHQQYLRAPLAMHVAYWHEDFGKRKSAECVNVSPIDGHFLFGWTEPQLPEGWNAVRPGDGFGKSTPIKVTAM